MAKKKKKKTNLRRILQGLVMVLTLVGLTAFGVLGWNWMHTLRCERIEIAGLQHADEASILELARVDTGLVLIDIDPAIVADRVLRHPWVQTARATRFPTGTLRISVQERIPLVLMLNGRGEPMHYLDRTGFSMPAALGNAYDVPLLRGVRTPHPVRPLHDEQVRELLTALANADVATLALISELSVTSGEVLLRATPVGARGAIPVRLGREGFAEKLARFKTFWHQAVLPQPATAFEVIDLRFDSQVVTRETVNSQPSAASP